MEVRPAPANLKQLTNPVKVLFASGSPEAIALVLNRARAILPELPLIIVAEFALPDPSLEWIPYHVKRSWRENLELIRARLGDRTVRISAIILEPNTPHWPMRRAGFALAPKYLAAFNEHGEHFMLRPRSIPAMVRHAAWRARNFVRSQLNQGGWTRKQIDRVLHPSQMQLPIYYRLALARAQSAKAFVPTLRDAPARPAGVSVVIPSRNGFDLLRECLPRIGDVNEIIVVDNGSTDGTAGKLGSQFPNVIVEHSTQPLSFAQAVNHGIALARFSHVCLLNNDMLVEPGFLRALRSAFDQVPDLFASSAQIFFPEGQRREETGKTVMPSDPGITELPLRCDVPVANEDLSYVLYGSGGCTLYDTRKLAMLGGFDEVYDPAYVEDLDLGIRAWQQGWPSVYCANARVLHFHRTTTTKYFTARELNRALEYNYLRFLSRAMGDRARFEKMWRANIVRLNLLKDLDALKFASHLETRSSDEAPTAFFDLCNGDVAVFPGKAASGKPRILIASPYLPFPLAHGAAVRIYNLMREAARDFDQVLVAFVEEAAAMPQELLDICVEVVTVKRRGTHALPSTERPDTVEEFDLAPYRAALRQTVAKWNPQIVQLEFTQMAAYANDCGSAKTILVEHDITFDLYAQMLAQTEDWETRRQYDRWVKFEREAWNRVDRVVVMSERDRAAVTESGRHAVVVANGVDLDRFRPSQEAPERRRLLFIGSFAHRPNVLAMEFFLREVFPKLADVTLHIIAGKRHESFWIPQGDRIEVEGFVSDVRPAYRRATLVIAPLVASAGTNIKIMEAMAMGKAIVSTEAGVHGIEVDCGHDVVIAQTADEMASEILRLLEDASARTSIEQAARVTAERLYGWDAIAARQAELYRTLISS